MNESLHNDPAQLLHKLVVPTSTYFNETTRLVEVGGGGNDFPSPRSHRRIAVLLESSCRTRTLASCPQPYEFEVANVTIAATGQAGKKLELPDDGISPARRLSKGRDSKGGGQSPDRKSGNKSAGSANLRQFQRIIENHVPYFVLHRTSCDNCIFPPGDNKGGGWRTWQKCRAAKRTSGVRQESLT